VAHTLSRGSQWEDIYEVVVKVMARNSNLPRGLILDEIWTFIIV
jgi:hypothetical protein